MRIQKLITNSFSHRTYAGMVAAIFALVIPGGVRATTPTCVTVVGTSDLHGAIEPHRLELDAAAHHKATPGDVEVLRYGGLMVQASYIRALRAKFPHEVVLVDGGDLYQGTMVSNLSRGKAVTAAYNALKFDAAAVGNHEFDYGPLKKGGADRLGVFKKRISESRFPFLAVNIREKRSGKPVSWAKPSVLITRNGIKVGIIGAATVETPRVTKPQNVVGLKFLDPAPLIVEEAKILRARGAKLIVFVAHMGGKCKNLSDPNDLSSCATESEMFDTLKRLEPGTVDIAVAGHTHAFVAHRVNGVATIQAGARGRQLAWVRACLPEKTARSVQTTIHAPVDLCLDAFSNGRCRRDQGKPPLQPAEFMGRRIEIDKEIQGVLRPFIEAVSAVQHRDIRVNIPKPLTRTGHEVKYDLGTLVAASLRAATHADVGIQNIGGVRADLPAGRLRYGQVFEVLPFGNKLSVVKLKGDVLLNIVQALINRRHKPPFVAGLKLKRAAGGVWNVFTEDGKSLNANTEYTLATNDFLVTGGEGLDRFFSQLPKGNIKISDTDILDSLIDLLRKRFPG